MSTPEFHLYLPQMRLAMDVMVEKARAAEAAGFTGMAGMDHLAPPMAEQHDMYEALTTNAWLLAHTAGSCKGSSCCATRSVTRRCSRARPSRSTTRRAAASSSASAGVRWSRSSRRTACSPPQRASASAA